MDCKIAGVASKSHFPHSAVVAFVFCPAAGGQGVDKLRMGAEEGLLESGLYSHGKGDAACEQDPWFCLRHFFYFLPY